MAAPVGFLLELQFLLGASLLLLLLLLHTPEPGRQQCCHWMCRWAERGRDAVTVLCLHQVLLKSLSFFRHANSAIGTAVPEVLIFRSWADWQLPVCSPEAPYIAGNRMFFWNMKEQRVNHTFIT